MKKLDGLRGVFLGALFAVIISVGIIVAIFSMFLGSPRGHKIDCTTYEFNPDATREQKDFCRGIKWKHIN